MLVFFSSNIFHFTTSVRNRTRFWEFGFPLQVTMLQTDEQTHTLALMRYVFCSKSFLRIQSNIAVLGGSNSTFNYFKSDNLFFTEASKIPILNLWNIRRIWTYDSPWRGGMGRVIWTTIVLVSQRKKKRYDKFNTVLFFLLLVTIIMDYVIIVI